MAPQGITRKLAVLLHADVAGSTTLVRLDETLAHARIQDTFQRFSRVIDHHAGIAHEVRGDALIAEFSRASDAVNAAMTFQADNLGHNASLTDDVVPTLRIGIAMGEVVVADHTVTGEGIVLAQRLEQLAEPGGVCLQDAVYQTLPKHLPFDFHYQGEHTLKGFYEAVRVYTVLNPSKTTPDANGTGSAIPARPPHSDRPSIAVLPFDNMSGDPEQEYFADGITEDIITALSRIDGLSVVARNSVMIYKGNAVDVKQVGQDHGVDFVLEGSVRKAGNRVRVTAQLIESRTAHHQWADRYDRNLDDIFEVQDNITHNIMVEMRVQLSLGEKARMLAGRTESVEAWEKQLMADELNNRFTRHDNRKARRLCNQALAIDPGYVSAWTELGWTHMEDVLCGWTESMEHSLEDTMSAIDRSLNLEPDYPFALSLLGYVHAMGEDYDKALEAGEKSVFLAPDNAEGVAELAHLQLLASHYELALATIKQAIHLCPTRLMWHVAILGQCHQMNGALEIAIATYREAALKGVGSPFPRVLLCSALMEAGDKPEAIRMAREVLQLESRFALSGFKALLFQNETCRSRLIQSLREAGLPD